MKYLSNIGYLNLSLEDNNLGEDGEKLERLVNGIK